MRLRPKNAYRYPGATTIAKAIFTLKLLDGKLERHSQTRRRDDMNLFWSREILECTYLTQQRQLRRLNARLWPAIEHHRDIVGETGWLHPTAHV